LLGAAYDLRNREMHISYDDPVNKKNDLVNEPNDPVNYSLNAKIISVLDKNPRAKYRDIAQATGSSISTIKRHIQELKTLNLIQRIGSDKTGYWKLMN
jgi:predicted HTH transcriptional regulator